MRRRPLFPSFAVPTAALLFAELSTVETIEQQIATQTDRAQAIVDLAGEEKRDLTDDEKTEIDAILGVGDPNSDDYQPGTIDRLEQDRARAQRLADRQSQLAAGRNPLPFARASQPTQTPAGDSDETPRAARVRVPIEAQYQHARLKAYKGPHAQAEAYIAGQFFLAVLFKQERAVEWCNEHGVSINAALSGSENHVLVPSEMERSIIDLREQYGVFRRNAEISPMSSDTKDHPYVNTRLTASFTGENEALTESDPTWGNAKLVAKKLGAITRISSEFSEDAIVSIGDNLTQQFAYAFALKEDQCGFLGDGTSTYGGIVGLDSALNAGAIHTALAGNVTFGTLDLVDYEAVIGKLPEYAGIDPKWYISKAGWANSMLRLVAAAGGNTVETLANGSRQMMFLGYPVEISQVLPSALTGTESTNLAFFGDLRLAAVLGNRRGIGIMTSVDRYFEFDQIGVKGTERVDITVHSIGDASDAGAVVALKTPAA